MVRVTVYDKAEYHYEGEFPDDLPDFQANVHSGFFLGWMIKNDLISDEIKTQFKEEIASFNRKEKTAAQLYDIMGGALVSDMLSEDGNAFTRYYFDFEKGKYLKDYEELLASNLPTIYHVKDEWKNFNSLCKKIDSRFKEWKDRKITSRK